MIDRIDDHPTPINYKKFDERGGKDRRKIHTMMDPLKDRRKGDRRKRNFGERTQKVSDAYDNS